MEVKVPRDVLKYEEAMFFGLSLRQFLYSVLAIGAAVGTYFLADPLLGTETASWLCIVAALPFALMGFVRYNNMTAVQFARAWVRSELLFPKVLVYHGYNLYHECLEQGRAETGKPKRQKPGKQPGKEHPKKRRREKDFERRGRNIYKFRKKGKSIR